MKNKIHLLEPSIAERIAAGEVIERPASVVKELMENSLDAHATEISVLLEDGGKSLIEIIDNGDGMPPDDLELSILRHATSKLSTLEDLEKIVTLGFRGEALASIAAVSDLNLTSRARNSDLSYALNVGDLIGRIERNPQAHIITFGHFLHSPHGTKISARGLFSQVPARLKFLKSQAAEVTQVRECMERLALAYPQVGFHLTSNDRVILNLRPQEEASRIRTILSQEGDYPLITVFHQADFQVHLHWLQGLSSPQSRKVIQIVNSRSVRDRMLQQAILSGFRQTLLPGQFPAVLLRMEIDPASIDVNVHPSKTEIRFLESQKIFKIVDSLVKEMIRQKGAPALAPMTFSPPPPFSSTSFEKPLSEEWPLPEARPEQTPSLWQMSEPTPPAPAPALQPMELNASRFVGILFQTYLAYENAAELILVDQHAAHERVQYEKLKRRILGTQENPAPLSSQSLLIPEVIRFPLENRTLLQDRLFWLMRVGFEVEIFGEDTLVFRSVPSEWGTKQLKMRLRNLVDRVLNSDIPSTPELMDENIFEALASEACHSSIRGGDRLEPVEAQELVHQLFHCDHPWNCPHGRPTVVKVPQGKLEEWFQRKI